MSIASFALMSTISNLVCSRSGYLCVAALCLIVDVDLLLADILLYHLLFLDNLLAQTDLLFYHRALLDYDLFLDDGYPELVRHVPLDAFWGQRGARGRSSLACERVRPRPRVCEYQP